MTNYNFFVNHSFDYKNVYNKFDLKYNTESRKKWKQTKIKPFIWHYFKIVIIISIITFLVLLN